jgi:hypothetical protein
MSMDGLQVADGSRDQKTAFEHQTDKFPSHTTSTIPTPATRNPFATTAEYGNPNAAYSQHQQPPLIVNDEKPFRQERRYRLPFGLSVVAYTAIIITVVAVILGAALGGAIGAVASNKDDCSYVCGPSSWLFVKDHMTDHARRLSSVNGTLVPDSGSQAIATTTVFSTVTASSTSTSPPLGSSTLVSNYAPLLPSQVYTAALNCTSGATVITGDGSQFQTNCNTNYAGNDMLQFVAYSLDDCLGACTNLNKISASNTVPCKGVLFNANVAACVSQGGGNCWLKSAMEGAAADILPPSVGAVLLSTG